MLLQRLGDLLRFACHQVDSDLLHDFHCRRIHIHRFHRCAFCLDFSARHLLEKSLSHLASAGISRGKEKNFRFTSHAFLPRFLSTTLGKRPAIGKTPYEVVRLLATEMPLSIPVSCRPLPRARCSPPFLAQSGGIWHSTPDRHG